MRKWTDRLGYLLVIIGTIMFLIQFKTLIFYASDYYLFGSKDVITITDRMTIGKKFVYVGLIGEGHKEYKLKSTPTKNFIEIGVNKEVLVSPNFKIFLLGKIVLFGYLVSILIFLLLSYISFLSIKKIYFSFK